MRSTTIYERGQVVVVNVPFSDRSGTKPRPALVVSIGTFHRRLPDLIVCPISSQPRYYRRPGPGDYPLQHWAAAGLHYASTVRISNIVAIDKRMIKRILGTVAQEDLKRVQTGLQEALDL